MNPFNIKDIQALVEQSLLEEPTGDSWLDSRYNEQVHWVGHTQPYYRAFYLIAQKLKPGLVVELGSWQATAAAHFAAGNPEGQVVTIDPHNIDKNAQTRAIEAAGHYENLTYLNRYSWDALDFFKTLDHPITVLFIDAWHEYQYAKKEWDLYSPLLSNPALVICDDIMDNPGVYVDMKKFWDELPGEKFLDDRIHPGIPLGFCKYENTRITKELPIIKRGRPKKELSGK